MAWAVTADPSRFDEAADWFLARSVITKDEAMRLDLDVRQRAFWIGGGLQLTQIQRVFDEIAVAIESGEDFDAWRKRVKKLLRDDAHAETVFRNAVQRSYSAGRWRQMNEPDVLKWRPYFMHDSVLDSRTTKTCRKLDGVTLPAEHEHWQTHWPPGHHRCRRGVRSLRKSEAERRGITTVPPALDDAPGFGLAPNAAPVWKPDRKKHDPALIKELEGKEGRVVRRKKPAAPPPIHDPKHWEDFYRKPTDFAPNGYGEAAPAMGWGRAMYERGLDRSAKEIVVELERLRDAGLPGLQGAGFAEFTKLGNRPLRGTTIGTHHETRGYIALAEHSLSIKRGAFPGISSYPAVKKANAFYTQLLDAGVQRPVGWRVELRTGARAYASPGQRLIVIGNRDEATVAVHEIAHAVESTDSRAVARSRAFLKARATSKEPKRLSELTKVAYDPNEVAFDDKWLDAYIGKDYGEFATEITSVGYEWLSKPFGIERLSEKDPEMLDFLLGQLAGR
jgi:SPP1 gp7 family putative phage head morphogenesis protein